MIKDHSILMTIDVEDWFQVENFKQYIPYSSWPSCELRVEKNTHHLLDLFDSIKLSAVSRQLSGSTNSTNSNHNPSTQNPELRTQIKATFFVLGWIAERLPHLVREIHSRGHEVASHGYYHLVCSDEPSEDLKKDLMDSKKLLEDIIGYRVYGYRAPTFSINPDVLKLIEDCGYLYDSSYNSFVWNKRYGQLDFEPNQKKGIAFQISDTFYELPICNLRPGKKVLPLGGGGYFRLLPFPLFKLGVQTILKKEKAYMLYLHPWELDPDQPRVVQASIFFRFRHYVNLNKTKSKLLSFLNTFKDKDCRFVTCGQYLNI